MWAYFEKKVNGMPEGSTKYHQYLKSQSVKLNLKNGNVIPIGKKVKRNIISFFCKFPGKWQVVRTFLHVLRNWNWNKTKIVSPKWRKVTNHSNDSIHSPILPLNQTRLLFHKDSDRLDLSHYHSGSHESTLALFITVLPPNSRQFSCPVEYNV